MFERIHKVYKPHPALKEFVNNITIQKVELDTSQPLPVFLMPPIQEQCLFFYPQDPVQVEYVPSHTIVQLHQNILLARRIKLINIIMGYHHMVVKVGFQPGGLYRLLGIPMNEFDADEGFESDYLIDKELVFIIEQLNEATSFEQMVSILQKWLLHKLYYLKKELPIDKALPYIIEKGTLHRISEVASEACVSIRQLERLYQQRIGLSPQLYARLVRFTKAWVIKEGNPFIKWTQLAYQCGYSDQMHLIHDFKEFTGFTPSLIEKDLRELPCSLQHEVFH